MSKIFILLAFISCLSSSAQKNYKALKSFVLDSNSSYRALDVSQNIVAIAGSNGSFYSIQSNELHQLSVEAKDIEFRDVHIIDSNKIIAMGISSPAVFYLKEFDTIREVYNEDHKDIFFDSFDFWPKDSIGIAVSDAIDNKLTLSRTENYGKSWELFFPEFPLLLDSSQGAFAASGSNVLCLENGLGYIALGSPKAMILKTSDFGKSWKVLYSLDSPNNSTGFFGISSSKKGQLFVFGGDYTLEQSENNFNYLSTDGGLSWKPILGLEGKYISSVSFLDENRIFCCSRFGSYYSSDAGKTWTFFNLKYYSCQVQDDIIWLSGSKGRLLSIMIDK